MRPGQKVRTARVVDRYPHFEVERGQRGTISSVTADIIHLKMDEFIPGCEEWDNEIVLTSDELNSTYLLNGAEHFIETMEQLFFYYFNLIT